MKKILSLFLCSLFVLAIPATALATGYSGREIQPDAQGCYRILGEAGDTMTLIGTGSFLSNITVTLDDSADDIVCIDTYLTKPGSAPDGLPNIAHGYIDIQGDSFNAALDYALIRFSVSKDWLNQNNISRDNIRLYHYQNGSWFQLATSVVSESATVVVLSLIHISEPTRPY